MKEIILTETSNLETKEIDLEDSLGIVKLINNEDKKVALAIEKELETIAKAVDLITDRLSNGGKLFYFGAGTSGRLGILDASECPPTFGVEPELVNGFIAGGDTALRTAIEGAEDSFKGGEEDVIKAGACSKDVVVAISASGGAAYVCGVLSKAKELNIATIALSCNKKAKMAGFADIHISPEVGPEAITGSTRMKAGTAQKLVLNMLTTATMVRLGKTYHNFMIDLKPTNKKLIDRATRIIADLTGKDYDIALEYLIKSDKKVKTAVVMIKKQIDKDEANKLLKEAKGKLRLIID